MSRPRRGSDDARSWVRSIHFGNPYAKAVMMALANYVNEDGTAYPGIETLHQDTEIAGNTIVARLKWCEAIGAITLSKCWVDENGQRNKAARGRPTSTEIRFLFDADIEAIEAAAHEHSADKPLRGWAKEKPDNPEISPAPHAEQISEPEKISSSVAPQQPCTPCGRILNQESPSPNPAQGRGLEKSEEPEKRFQEFKSAYPDGIVDLEAARRAFVALPEPDQRACIVAIPAYAARCRKRREKSMKAHLFIKKRGWEGLTASPAARAAALSEHAPNSPTGRALLTLGRIAHYRPFQLASGGLPYQGEVTPRLLAMGNHPPEGEWQTFARGTPNFAAWWKFINEIFVGRPLPALPQITAPWPWPPRVDGTHGQAPQSTGPPNPLTPSDQSYLSENGL